MSSRLLRQVTFAAVASLLGSAPVFAADHQHTAAASPSSAVAVLVAGADSKVSGTVHFSAEADGVRVKAEITGLTPGQHGFHVHEKGDLSKPDFTSAGGHFNPTGHPHAARTANERHAGDLGNLEADQSGRATVDFIDKQLKLSGPQSIIGRSVVVHAKADDLKSQPSGDAGGRVAAGVIGVADSKPADAKK